ncbi:glycoside hydrolase family 30 protein [Plenodomus tracheiphilus IPT5]|uniref:Glycoside hydrolase family 30 protein n=1 Tax=Plenodomus tracheiphilus IPT5 TaxID=1408161 RepID=A0A6A7AV15_9PLEO|nr:glycoside hydrolase family 30 protein [Plenodomus tracheiphilus IPT5]
MRFQSSVLAALAAIPLLTTAKPALDVRQSQQKITVDLTKRYQTIDGFGFSAAFQRANLIVNLQAPKQREVLDLLFNTTTGAGFSILRNGIGSTPNSNSDYMNTILPKCPSTPAEVTVDYSGYVWDGKDSGQLFLSHRAKEYGVTTFYANAWSAPGCMKTNGQDTNGGQLCGVSGTNCRTGSWLQAYANYLVAHINFYASSNISITHLGFLNEPDLTTSYASMLSSGTQAADLIKILRPTLDRANLTHIGITCCDATGWNVASQHASQIASAGAEKLIYAITSHEYSSRITNPLRTAARVWQTEYSDLNGAWSTAWYTNGAAGDGFTWANTIFNGIVNANLSAYIFWEGVQDRATNNNNNEKLILVEGQNYQVSKRLWAFAQWRVVRPGAVRVACTTVGGSGMKVAAFLNADGGLAVVGINSGTGAQTVGVVVGDGFGMVRAWVTDNSRDMSAVEVAVASDGVASASLVVKLVTKQYTMRNVNHKRADHTSELITKCGTLRSHANNLTPR